jgi:hypothetical protein
LVKRWAPGELESLRPILDAVLARDPEATVSTLVRARFLPADHGVDPQRIYEYCSSPYIPFQVDHFTYDPEFVARTLERMLDFQGEFGDLIRQLNMPPSYVILDRVVWGLSALFGRMRASGRWGAMLDEYLHGAPPTTELGAMDAEWRRERIAAAAS